MSSGQKHYYDVVQDLCTKIYQQELEAIDAAADLMVEAIRQDELIHAIGTGGHSNIGAWELFYRAGGLACVNAILDPGTSLEPGARRSTVVERSVGYGITVLDAYEVNSGVLIIINAYGLNTMTIDVALEAKRRGVPTIGVTSRAFSESVPGDHPARHPSKQNLCDLVDVHLDCHMPIMDAVVEVEGVPALVGPTSTILNCFLENLLVIRTVEKCVEQGIEPPVNISGNIAKTPEMNAYVTKTKAKYEGRLAHY